MQKVEKDNIVKVHYTGRLEDGQTFDSSEDREPLEFKVGAGNMIPGFENAVKGMQLGESKTVTLVPEEAYGNVNQNLIQEISRDLLPADLNPQCGMQLVSESPDGHRTVVSVTDVKEESIIIDANHPLAGKNLIFDIEIVEIS
ncbi:MAG: peptidylprolyl isomerase [Bacteroidales bacterium]|nr:peptidylprolyl isomerase [Bacteroidales bacterium]